MTTTFKQHEIIEMARQTLSRDIDGLWLAGTEDLEAFTKLVEAKVEARYMQLFLDPENQPTQFGTATQEYRDQEILEEREACIAIAESKRHAPNFQLTSMPPQNGTAVDISNAIRARAQAERGEQHE